MENARDSAASVSVEAVVDRVTYSNEENGWSVVRLISIEGDLVTATGPLLGVREGDRLRLSGKWVTHSKFGQQLEVADFLEILPSTVDGIRLFLASGRIKGIGPRNAQRLVERFGIDTLDVIEHDSVRLAEIHGIGPKTADKISKSWAKHRGIQRIVIFLASHGVSPTIAIRLHRRYGDTALSVVRDNPYRLAEEVYGVGFLTADRIAQQLGMAKNAPERLAAGLVYALSQASLEGHLFLPDDDLVDRARALLEEESLELRPIIEGLRRSRQVVVHPRARGASAVFLTRLDRAEHIVAQGIARLVTAEVTKFERAKAAQEVARFEGGVGIDLASEQRGALMTALEKPVTVVTGGPGTGKTTLVLGLVEILNRRGDTVLLAAPTGRAAKRLEEAAGQAALTLHRLLEFNPVERNWGRCRERPLSADLVVVDEVSMLDAELASRLVDAIPSGCRLMLVGDVDQLPSVGPGDVLNDLIKSGAVPVCRLQRIFRQGEGSLIAHNAHRINRGENPVYPPAGERSDFYFAIRPDPEEAATTAVEMAAERIPNQFGLDPIRDIQVLAPMHRGDLGVTSLNRSLQERLVPAGGPEIRLGTKVFRQGDKVMQLRNNYEIDVFNGDVGRVLDLDSEERTLTVEFSGREVVLESDDLEDVTTAYACTIHKSQGSEYPAVVVVLHEQHHVMLQRNLLYTAVTRGKRLVVLVGSRRALARAVRTATVRQRNTMLTERLQARHLVSGPAGVNPA